jgi:3-phenylpropionate/cinnamic acid dioxygenase small subunit
VRRTVQPKSLGGRNEPEEVFSLYNDDKASLAMRVQRIETGIAHAEVPLSVTQRLVTNVLVEPEAGTAGFVAHSRFTVHQVRGGRLGFTFYGKRRDRLRREGGALMLAERRIELAQTILPTTISIFF